MGYRICVLVALACFCAQAAAAADKEVVVEGLARVDDGDGRSSAAGFSSKVVLEAQEGKGVGTLRVAGFHALSIERFARSAFTVSTPFDSDKVDSADVGTLSGLTAGSSAKLEAGLLFWPFIDAAPLEEICETEIPKLIIGGRWTLPAPDHLEGLTTKTDLACEERLFDLNVLAGIVDTVNKERMQKWQAAADKAHQEGNPAPPVPNKLALAPADVAAPVIEGAIQRLRQGNATFKGLHTITVGLIGNRNDYSYVLLDDPATTHGKTHKGRGASIAYTLVGHQGVFNVGLQYERSYKGGKTGQICNPIPDTDALQCADAAIGAPAEKTSKILFVEGRRIYSGKLRLAISPRVEYEAEESDVGISVPVYLVPNGDGALIGGLKIGWTEEDDIGVSVFVGKAFDLFN